MRSLLNIACVGAVVVSTWVSACGGARNASDPYVEGLEVEHAGDEPIANESANREPIAQSSGDPVVYGTRGADELVGYVASPIDIQGPVPGILLIHEWWGLNENIETTADQLASYGYVVLAVDLYGGDVAEDSDTARAYMQAASEDPRAMMDNVEQGLDWLEGYMQVTGLGVMGWCFGGGQSLQSGIEFGDRLDAIVVYYGRLTDDVSELSTIEAPILGHFGETDASIPPEAVDAFDAAARDAGLQATTYVYEGAGHAFANPSGTRYEADAADTAWERTIEFFAQHLRARDR